MKRKALLIVVLLSFACFGVANAQTLFSEDFEDGSMPTGWTTSGNGSWSVAMAVNSTHPSSVGHGTYCAQIKHGTTGNATKLITPEINLSTVTSAELSFMHVEQSWSGDIDGLKVYYRTSASETWTQLVEYTDAYASWTTEEGIILPNLSSTYQLAFEYIDNYGYGLGIDYVNITQGASCPKPASLTAMANGQSAILNWISDASSFDIAWSLNPNADPDQYIETTGHNATTFTRSDLTVDADYYFWVRANCGNDGISTWAGPVSVHIGFCAPAPSSVDRNGITQVVFTGANTITNTTHPTSAPYYGNYTAQVCEVEAGETATVAITYATGYTYKTYIWVDLNNDFTFDNSEILYSGESSNSNPTTLTATITIPATTAIGNHRMRIGGADSGMDNGGNPCYNGTYGIFEDYTLNVTAASPCKKPTNLAATNVTANEATLSWTENGEATAWNIDINGTMTQNVTDNPYTLTNLTPSTSYTVKVAPVCEDERWSAPYTFHTTITTTQIVNTVSDPTTQMTWSQFVQFVNNGETFQGTTVTLMEDISVTEMVGTTSRAFTGTFDGNGHTITVDFTTNGVRGGLFNTANNATFKNLTIDGTMSVGHVPSGALVGYVHQSCHIINCVSNVEITATITSSGDNGIGGFLGEADRGSNPQIYFDGCAFTGKFIGTNNGWGGFVGRNRGYVSWSSSNSDVYFTNCVFAPAELPSTTTSCATFARSDNYSNESRSHVHITNSYYTQALGEVQGKQAYTISGESPVTVAMNGEATEYDLSGITAYTTGIVYGGTIYAGNGDQVALSLSYTGSDSFSAYIVNNGSLTGTAVTGSNDSYTLTMANGNAVISVMAGDTIHAIYTKADWETFCAFVNNGHTYEGETVTLEADLIDDPVTTVCGLESNPFKGVFDGQGHTLTVNIPSSGNQGNAPFKYISNATIKNLVVDGTVNAGSGDSNRHASGLVGYSWSGTNTIENCLVNTNVTSGCDYAGGIIGHGKTSNIVMTGCAYTGTITATGTNPVGGLVGWSDNLTGLTITDCFFNGNYSNSNSNRKFHPIGCTSNAGNIATETRIVSNTYYTLNHSNLNATSQTLVYNLSNKGKLAYTITGDSPITVAMSGTPSEYNVSGITAYTVGIVYGGTIYAGNGDNVSLNLNGSEVGYSAIPGVLTGESNPYTLQMTDSNTLITSHFDYITEIHSVEDWNTFRAAVNSGHTYTGETVTLMADISVTEMVGDGTGNTAFQGTFDGQGHIITVDFTATTKNVGLFRVSRNAAFLNLRIEGTINSDFNDEQRTGSLVGYTLNSISVTNCISAVNIVSTGRTGSCHNGGFIGELDSWSHLTMEGCAFIGSFTGTTATQWGGLVGFTYGRFGSWMSEGQGATSDITNCIFAPQSVNVGAETATFSYGWSNNGFPGITVINSYYTQALGQVQGKQAYSISSFETSINPITVELYGEYTNYDVSGITGYATGIIYDNIIYAGDGDNVSLALEGSPTGAYTASYGTITGIENPFTLAMVAHDTEISALTCPPPTMLEASPTAYSAVLNWNGISDNYNLRFYEAQFFDSFEEDLSQWTIYKEGDDESWEWGIENPHDNSADLNAHSGAYAVVAYSDDSIHADSWLVSPQIQFPTQTTLKFWVMRSTYDDAKDEYEVRLSTTGNAIEDFTTVLKEKAAANSTWTEVSIDLSAYDGQQCYIAIRHDYTNGFFIMVDDFGIYGWSEPIPVSDTTYTAENLRPDTYYLWQVQANCGDEDGTSFWSEGDFTTLIACPVPFGLEISETTANGATIAWTGYNDSYNVWVGQLEMASTNYDFENDTIISADFTNSTLYPWTVTSNDKHSGTYSVKSGNAGTSNSTSDLNLEVTIEHDATLSFWAKASSESGWDYGRFLIDGTQQFQTSGTSNSWTQYSYELGAGTHTLIWRYTKDNSSDAGDDCFYVDDITIESEVIVTEMNYTATESPLILNDATNILPQTNYMVKVKGICGDEETEYSEAVTFSTLDENTKIFANEGDWSDSNNWVPAGVPSIEQNVILRAEATVFDVAEANIITIEGNATLTIEDGGQLKTNSDVTATMKKFIIGYGTDYVETNNGYYLMTLPTAAPISAADAGLLTEESDYDLYSWDRTATDEEWQNNHDGIDLQNGVGFLYANRDDMEMLFTATLRNSSEPVVVTPSYDEVEHGGWNLCGNPFPCEAYITTDAEGMAFYRLVDNQLELIEGAIAPLEAFFVKATAAGQIFTISREAPRE